ARNIRRCARSTRAGRARKKWSRSSRRERTGRRSSGGATSRRGRIFWECAYLRLIRVARAASADLRRSRCRHAGARLARRRANAVGDDVELYTDESRSEVLATFHFLRQQMQKPAGQFNHCLADYVAPKGSASETLALRDYLGGFAVTGGIGADELAERFKRDH